jgi:hypothetical protein
MAGEVSLKVADAVWKAIVRTGLRWADALQLRAGIKIMAVGSRLRGRPILGRHQAQRASRASKHKR